MHWLSVSLITLALAAPVTAGPEQPLTPAAPSSASSARASSVPDAQADGGPRLRPVDTRAATLLVEGMRRSPSLATLVQRLDGGDVIVYLEIDAAMNDRLAGSIRWMTTSGGFRYVRASLNPDFGTDALIAAIGHELHHATEILEHPWVTDPDSLRVLYKRIGNTVGRTHLDLLDTLGARNAGTRVGRALRMTRLARASTDGAVVSPAEWYRRYQPVRPRAGLPH